MASGRVGGEGAEASGRRKPYPSPGRRRRGGSGGDGAPVAARTGGTGRGRGAGSWAGWLRWAEAHGRGARWPAGPVGPVEEGGGAFPFFLFVFLGPQ